MLGWLYFIWQTRKIWSSVRIHSIAHICRHVLSLLRICWYVHVSEITIILQLPLWKSSASYSCYQTHYHFPYAGGVGLSFLQFCNLNSFRTKFIMGFAFFMGLSVPQYFNEYTAVAGYGPVHTGARWVWERNPSYTFAIPLDNLSYDKLTDVSLRCLTVQRHD